MSHSADNHAVPPTSIALSFYSDRTLLVQLKSMILEGFLQGKHTTAPLIVHAHVIADMIEFTRRISSSRSIQEQGLSEVKQSLGVAFWRSLCHCVSVMLKQIFLNKIWKSFLQLRQAARVDQLQVQHRKEG